METKKGIGYMVFALMPGTPARLCDVEYKTSELEPRKQREALEGFIVSAHQGQKIIRRMEMEQMWKDKHGKGTYNR